uniref:WSC domain containing 1 n=1 Tax=Cyclopterus lumpus TaxID=8103 RepID=A0A8C2ZLW3_CYCLU
MAAPHCRLHCLLKRAQMLLLCLGIAYLMAGSILLLQRSSVRVAQPNLAGLPPLLALAAPPTVLRAWAGLAKAGRHWPASQSLGVQHFLKSCCNLKPPFLFHSGCFSLPAGTYMGCFLHNASGRALGGTMLYDLRKMTSSLCQDTCSESGFQFAGLEFGAECHCGNRISSTRAPEEDCGLVCRGERGSPCGGVGRLSIYKVEQQGHTVLFILRSRCISSEDTQNMCALGLQELPLAVFKKPHCFCTWTSSLFSLDQQSDQQQCVEDTGRNHTGSSPEHAHYQVYHTPVLDSMCKERMFLPQRSSSLVALSSFPGAGNTWVRHLIELVTGYYTGSFYFDGTLYNRGFKGEKDYWKSGRSICVKTHESGQKEIEMFDSAILLIRNPYRSLVAEFNRKCAGHLGHATDAQWKSQEWPEFVSSYAPWWASHALSWLKFGRRLLVVHYEELQRALLPQLQVITAFLNVTMMEEKLLCAQSNQDGHFKRSGAPRSSFDPFTPDMRRMIDPFIHSVDQALHSRNFSGLPQEYLPR